MLCSKDEENREIIIKCDGVNLLCSCLKQSDTDILVNSLAALYYLAESKNFLLSDQQRASVQLLVDSPNRRVATMARVLASLVPKSIPASSSSSGPS